MKKLIVPFLFLFLTLTLQAQHTKEIKNIAFFLQDGVEILDFAGPMEVFISADFNVYTVAETKAPIKAMGTLTVVPDYSIEDSPEPDMVAFFGGGAAATVSQKPAVRDWVNRMVAKTDLQFSVCTGAFFLGEAGLLNGRTATTFHSAIPYLQERFPESTVRNDVRFVDNGSVITTAGISAGIDGALHLVARIRGMQQALLVAQHMEYFGWQPEKGLVLESDFSKRVKSDGLANALKTIDENTLLFPGELMDLGHELAAAGAQQKAVEIYEYALNTFSLTESDCEVIRKTFVAAGKAAPPSLESIETLVKSGNYAEAGKIIMDTHRNFPNWVFFPEQKLNAYGYQLLAKKEIDQAIEVFKLNVQIYPKSFNPYDSLGEAYMIAEKWDLAVKNYQKSLELNPKNENGRKMLEKLDGMKTDGKQMER